MHKLLHQSWPLDGSLTQHMVVPSQIFLNFSEWKHIQRARTSKKTNSINISSIVIIRTEYIVQ